MQTKKEGIVLVVLFSALFLSTMAWAVDCPVPDTGQTKCYDDTEEITCPQPGEDFYGQDAQYPCNPQSYTKLDENGNDLPDTATEWVMVRDNVTGLIWEVKTDDGRIHNKDDTYAWQDAQDVFIATLNNDNFGGYSDWRLPTIKELSFIRKMDVPNPSINTDYFPNTVSSSHWSSTSLASSPGLVAWYVYFNNGGMHFFDKSDNNYVRAVRGGQCGSFGDFVDNSNGTVIDTDTGLMWQQDTVPAGTYTWQDALSYCENLTLAGYNDWRLPNANELQSLVDYSRYLPSIDPVFPNTVLSFYWSSTSFDIRPSPAWIVHFSYGNMYNSLKSPGNYVRAVRGGQCGSFDTSTTTTADGSTTTTNGGLCSSELIYGEQSEEVDTLRYFRDNVLSMTPEGKELIKLYYQWSPAIVKAMEKDEEFKEEAKEMVDGILELIRETE